MLSEPPNIRRPRRSSEGAGLDPAVYRAAREFSAGLTVPGCFTVILHQVTPLSLWYG